MESEPSFIGANGIASDAELHAPMLDGNPDADNRFSFDVICSALVDGMPLETAMLLFGTIPEPK